MKKIDFHVHTNITDGVMSIPKVMDIAQKVGLQEIAFTEHIAKQPNYDWREFKREVLKYKPRGLNVLIGVEAKVLNDRGELNVDSTLLKEADIVLGAVHGVGDVLWLLKSSCHIIAHPQITDENIKYFDGCQKILEINPKKKYRLHYHILSKLVQMGMRFSFGSNAHIPRDLEMGQRYFERIRSKYPNIRIASLADITKIKKLTRIGVH